MGIYQKTSFNTVIKHGVLSEAIIIMLQKLILFYFRQFDEKIVFFFNNEILSGN